MQERLNAILAACSGYICAAIICNSKGLYRRWLCIALGRFCFFGKLELTWLHTDKNPIFIICRLRWKRKFGIAYGFNPIHKNIAKRITAITSVIIAILRIAWYRASMSSKIPCVRVSSARFGAWFTMSSKSASCCTFNRYGGTIKATARKIPATTNAFRFKNTPLASSLPRRYKDLFPIEQQPQVRVPKKRIQSHPTNIHMLQSRSIRKNTLINSTILWLRA